MIDKSIKFFGINIAILTISDTRDFDNDKSGSTLKKLVEDCGHTCVSKDIIKDEDIKEWEKENEQKVLSLNDHKRNAKIEMYYWTYYRYKRQLYKFETEQVEDPDLLKDIYNLQDRLQTNYLKKVE